ncbi:hypothetical protein CICLE_v10002623mg [Citrus x clementina]|uniref:Uncharacterized protein n=1 Tax=Citrus clementina TaxID=85681 RepID=V4SEF6_CITCL|nr:hypothetical protein CICLE_v10002623mg [Citrus x clementina]
MVLWEITLGTAYFLGLKRTYRLALRIQRRVISPKHPRIRQFVHRNIQQRDIEVGRNVGNWILRWLDRMKPSAQIHGPPEKLPHGPSMNMTNHGMKSSNPKTPGVQTSRNKESDLHLFSSSKNIWPKLPFSTIAMMMRHPRPAGTITQYRHLQTNGSDQLSLNYNRNGFDGVLRKDIRQWLLQM